MSFDKGIWNGISIERIQMRHEIKMTSKINIFQFKLFVLMCILFCFENCEKIYAYQIEDFFLFSILSSLGTTKLLELQF